MSWDSMLRAALMSGIAPEAFWRLSVKEWRALCGAGDETLTRERLRELMALHPDAAAFEKRLDPRLRGDERWRE